MRLNVAFWLLSAAFYSGLAGYQIRAGNRGWAVVDVLWAVLALALSEMWRWRSGGGSAGALFWRLPVRWEMRWLRAVQWFRAHTPHQHYWVGSESWSHGAGWVRGDDYCAVCGKRRPPSERIAGVSE